MDDWASSKEPPSLSLTVGAGAELVVAPPEPANGTSILKPDLPNTDHPHGYGGVGVAAGTPPVRAVGQPH